MPIWTYNGADWSKCPWHKLSRPDPCVIFGTGKSLLDADTEERGAFRIVQNNGYERVRPDLWIGMDKPDHFSLDHWTSNYTKLLRGNYNAETFQGIPIYLYPSTYFADIRPDGRDTVFFNRGVDAMYCWNGYTLTVAIHVALVMGFRTLIFSGIDLQGEYFDDRSLDETQRGQVANSFVQEEQFLRWFADVAKTQGIQLVNRSPASKLAAFMLTKKAGEA